jgi:hypothetical protein|tara:strand:+ start:218 stop:418 length:201 start_codon:yes stop_codon:yes gene_type:complete
MKDTNIFIVINDRTLNTMKGFGGRTAKFKTKEQADDKAATKLELWTVVPIKFSHPFVQHTAPLTHL